MGFVKKAPQLQDYMETILMILKAEIPKTNFSLSRKTSSPS
jgi:hypothetical protein